jgi:N-acetylgalactosamine-6-sulfatase
MSVNFILAEVWSVSAHSTLFLIRMRYILILLAALLLSPLGALIAAEKTKPNIVFIYADDWGWGDLSCHGNTWLKTPRLDKLASEGIDFQQFNVLSPVCSPSRAAAMTGRFPGRFGINTVFGVGKPPEMPDWLDPKAPTTPRLLKAAGYRSGHFGKWHLGEGSPTMADYGFDESAVYHGPGPKVGPSGNDIPNQAVKFIEANKDRPFYVNVWLHESHLAHTPSAESMEKWKHLDPRQQVYAAVITDGDNKVGMILDALERCGIAQNTLVVFSSDNGPAKLKEGDKGESGKYRSHYNVGETGGLRGQKTSLFEGGVRVPFIVRWPGQAPAGLKNDATVLTAVDLLPTFCAAAGVTPPTDANGDGENLLPALKGKSVQRTRPIFWRTNGDKKNPNFWPDLAVRDGDWKLVTTFDGQKVELHNLKSNRAEDIAKDQSKDHPGIVARLTKLALDWKATLPTKADPSCLAKPQESEPKKLEDEAAPKSEVPAKDRSIPFNRWDTNKDEFLTLEEYKTGQKDGPDLESRFKRFDKDGDGKVSRKEFVTPSAK